MLYKMHCTASIAFSAILFHLVKLILNFRISETPISNTV